MQAPKVLTSYQRTKYGKDSNKHICIYNCAFYFFISSYIFLHCDNCLDDDTAKQQQSNQQYNWEHFTPQWFSAMYFTNNKNGETNVGI